MQADDQHEHGTAKTKPYPLKTCVVSGEMLGGHGKPYVFTLMPMAAAEIAAGVHFEQREHDRHENQSHGGHESGMLALMPAGGINTLANAALEWDAGRNILGMQSPWFVGVPFAEFVRERHRAGAAKVPESLRAAHDAGQFFLTLEVATKARLPMAKKLAAQVNERLPAALRADRVADWEQRPMQVKPRP